MKPWRILNPLISPVKYGGTEKWQDMSTKPVKWSWMKNKSANITANYGERLPAVTKSQKVLPVDN